LVGEHVPFEMVNDTDVEGSGDAEYRIRVTNMPARLRMSQKGVESLKTPGAGFMLLIKTLADTLTGERGNIACFGSVP
jgi:hypothetical protein